MFGDFAGCLPITRVESGLAAARLIFRKLDRVTKVFEDFHGRAGDVVVEGITKAGAHEEHAFTKRAGGGVGHEKDCCETSIGNATTAATPNTFS